jgi:hypothetical protein
MVRGADSSGISLNSGHPITVTAVDALSEGSASVSAELTEALLVTWPGCGGA